VRPAAESSVGEGGVDDLDEVVRRHGGSRGVGGGGGRGGRCSRRGRNRG
jgi:hypothetical protein